MTPARRFWLLHAVLPLAAAALALVLLETTGLDVRLCDLCHDFARHSWPATDLWIVEVGLHRRLRDVVVLVGIAALARTIANAVGGRPVRRADSTFLLLSIVLGCGLVAAAKRVTNIHCPWDLARYGGKVAGFGSGPLFCTEGHGLCFPSGHASGGYALLALYFIGRRCGPRAAAAGLAVGLGTGTLMGATQVMRGAHFASHSVWSAAICWGVCLGLHVMLDAPCQDAPR